MVSNEMLGVSLGIGVNFTIVKKSVVYNFLNM